MREKFHMSEEDFLTMKIKIFKTDYQGLILYFLTKVPSESHQLLQGQEIFTLH